MPKMMKKMVGKKMLPPKTYKSNNAVGKKGSSAGTMSSGIMKSTKYYK